MPGDNVRASGWLAGNSALTALEIQLPGQVSTVGHLSYRTFWADEKNKL